MAVAMRALRDALAAERFASRDVERTQICACRSDDPASTKRARFGLYEQQILRRRDARHRLVTHFDRVVRELPVHRRRELDARYFGRRRPVIEGIDRRHLAAEEPLALE